MVSIHTPTQGVTIRGKLFFRLLTKFQSTHPRRVWQQFNADYFAKVLFQSTHPRRVWRQSACKSLCSNWVSIHTPTQGVTSRHNPRRDLHQVSIHTPTQGVTISAYSPISIIFRFNPHTHAGCDIRHPIKAVMQIVSIHTPTQGVTNVWDNMVVTDGFQSTHPRRVWLHMLHHSYPYNCFNPHTHAGCDAARTFLLSPPFCFNPHTHAGCDTHIIAIIWLLPGFNPHTHAGCDLVASGLGRHLPVSIHTPTQGVTTIGVQISL